MTTHQLSAAAPNPKCRLCGHPVTCYPVGHHCGACGHHDDQACDKHPAPQPGEQPWYAETIALPADVFDPIAAHARRRDIHRWAIHADTPMAHAVRELSAAIATGSRRLTPMAAFRLAQSLAAVVPGCDIDLVDDRPFWAVLDLMTPSQRDECRAVDDAEREASMAEYRAWRAQQLEAQGGAR